MLQDPNGIVGGKKWYRKSFLPVMSDYGEIMKVARKSNKMFFFCPCVSSLLDRPWLLNCWHVTRQIKMAKMKQAVDRNMNGPRNSPCLHLLYACLIYEVQKPSYQSSFCDLQVKGSHVLIYWWSFSTSRVALVVSRLRGFSIMSKAAAFSGGFFFLRENSF